MRTSYVYLIGAERGPIKIGHATNAKSRLSTLQVGNWEPLSILHSVSVPWMAAPKIESALKQQYQERRVRGEWFAVPLEVLRPSLEGLSSAYARLRSESDWFSEQVCFALCEDPVRTQQAVSAYLACANRPTTEAYIGSINRLLLNTVGQAAYLMFQAVIVQHRDVGRSLRNKSRLARQAEESLVKALNALTLIWERAQKQGDPLVDFSQRTAA